MAFFEKQTTNDPFAKMNSDVDAAKAELEASYNALGKAYFEACGADGDERFASQIEAINAAKKKAEILTELRIRMRGMKVCRECGAEVSAQAVFCNLCGAKIPDPEPLCDGDTVYCNNCASPMKIGQAFCSYCGAKLPLAEEEAVPVVPVAAEPVPEAPVEEAPVEEAPVEEAPVEEVPAEEPVYEAPAPEEPVSEAPAEESPVEAPAEEAPAAEPHAEEVPAPEAPDTKVCPNCGKILSAKMKFCTSCGTNLTAPVTPAEPICPNCGKTASPSAMFCTGCGTRLK